MRLISIRPLLLGFILLTLIPLALRAEEGAAAALTEDQAHVRIDWLRAEIARHDGLYFKKAAPEISDAAYDALKRELARLRAAFAGVASAPLPMGDDRSGDFSVVRHAVKMQGLDKVYTDAELVAFCAGLGRRLGRAGLVYVVEPKFDGLAISLTYENGRLVRAVTRGNGVEGDDVTANARTIPELAKPLAPGGDGCPPPERVELRGEIYVDNAEFERLNAVRADAGEPPFAHPRNLAAGTLKSRAPSEVTERRLRVVLYGWGVWTPGATAPVSQQAFHALVRGWGLPGVDAFRVATGADAVVAAVRAMGNVRSSLAFPTDGVVVKLDEARDRAVVGEGDDAPRWAIAYKFAPERVATRLRAITVQVGRTGVLTPVAELEPASLGGATVARATLHNADEIARRDVRVGDYVYLERAGEVIPAIIGVELSRRPADAVPYVFPSVCPECGSAVVRAPGEAAIRCPNVNCEGQVRRRIEHFTGMEGVAINGLGPAAINALVRQGRVRTVADLYRLSEEELAAAGLGKAAARVRAQIQASKRVELGRFVCGLGIPDVGAATARALAAQYGSLADMARGTNAVAGYFAREENRMLPGDFQALDVCPVAAKPEGGPLAGKTLVLTGTLPTWSRAEATRAIVAAGGKVAGQVTRTTDWIVVGAEAGKKRDEARALGVPELDEAGLRARLGL